jgi:2-polyprenyl-6-hydroxyphenyl methylase/3-demethylubiquinone-9 3-methyltransferase
MSGYYTDRLAAENLRQCYEIAPSATRAYLRAEIEFVLSKLTLASSVLELGCGYGRVLSKIVSKGRSTWGIDTSLSSLLMAREYVRSSDRCYLALMDAVRMGFPSACFDVVLCVQNGISAFAVDPVSLVREAVRVTRSTGVVLFSSYSNRFWSHRLEWFEAQAAHGLIGEIDHEATGDGVIVCKDGFRATTVRPEDFRRLAAEVDVEAVITEVDGSSLFCELVVP